MGKIWIGTSGWTYDGWRERFYPKDVPKQGRIVFCYFENDRKRAAPKDASRLVELMRR
jgi:uncharacterized protein YecE (DUF72 family)